MIDLVNKLGYFYGWDVYDTGPRKGTKVISLYHIHFDIWDYLFERPL